MHIRERGGKRFRGRGRVRGKCYIIGREGGKGSGRVGVKREIEGKFLVLLDETAV